MIVFAFLAVFYIEETEYFNGEEDVVVPKHVIEEHAAHSIGEVETKEEKVEAIKI